MAFKNFWDALKKQTKKGSTYKTRDGKIKKNTDFQRGKAAGRMEQINNDTAMHNLRTGKDPGDNIIIAQKMHEIRSKQNKK